MINAFRPFTHIQIENVGFSFPSTMQTVHNVRRFNPRCSVLNLIPPTYGDDKCKKIHLIHRLFPLFETAESSFRPFEFSMGNNLERRPPREGAVSNIRWNKILAKIVLVNQSFIERIRPLHIQTIEISFHFIPKGAVLTLLRTETSYPPIFSG